MKQYIFLTIFLASLTKTAIAGPVGGGGTPPAISTEIDKLLTEVSFEELNTGIATDIEKKVSADDFAKLISAGLTKRPYPIETKDGHVIKLKPSTLIFENGTVNIPLGRKTLKIFSEPALEELEIAPE